MKKYVCLLAIVVVMLFTSCDKLKETIEITFKTNIETEFPVNSQKLMAIQVKSAQIGTDMYGFMGGGTFTLDDVEELRKYAENLNSIIAEKGSVIALKGTVEGDKIVALKMKYGILINPSVQPPMNELIGFTGELPSVNGVIEYKNDSWSPVLVGALDANRDKVFVIYIEGIANYKVNSTVKIKAPVKISASPL